MSDVAEILEEDIPEDEEMMVEDEAQDDAPVALNDVDLVRAVEAMLFASDKPLSLAVLRERLPDGADVGGILLDIQSRYEGRGVSLVNIDGLWAFRTAPDLGHALQLKREVKRPLSRAAMETLAIVAYHQPVTRAEIENIRGVVTSGGTLDILMEAGWVKPGRRRETAGRPLTWVTTTEFLDHFGLQSLNELPGMEELKASGLLDRRPAIETTTQDLFDKLEEEDTPESGDEDEEVIMTEEELAELKTVPEEESEAEDSIDDSDVEEYEIDSDDDEPEDDDDDDGDYDDDEEDDDQ
jgi:segregation and condensation protein B